MRITTILKVLITVVLMAMVVPAAQAQYYYLLPHQADEGGQTDSTSFSRLFNFTLVPGTKLDSTVQLLYWQNSDDGTPHALIRYRYGWNVGGTVKYSTNYDTLSSDHSTEGVVSWEALINTADDAENAADATMPYNLIQINVQGAASNRADIEFMATIGYLLNSR